MRLLVIWRDSQGHANHKYLKWHGPGTQEALQDYMDNYFEMLGHGYLPKGFDVPPSPHCARILNGPRFIAEWYSNPKRPAESRVTAEPLGSGGIPNV